MNSSTDTAEDELIHGVPAAYWDAIGQPALVLMLGSGLGPAAEGLIGFVAERSSSLVYQDVTELAAQHYGRRFKGDNAEFLVADPLNLPFNRGQFDLAVSYWSAHHCPDPRLLLREIFRILKPGGHLLLADGLDLKGTPAQDLHLKIHQFSIAIDQARRRQHTPLLSHPELIELVYAAGFEDVTARKITETLNTLEAEKIEVLRKEALRLLSRVYPEEIKQIPDGEKRFARRLKSLTQTLTSSPLELHPYVVLQGAKPQAIEGRPSLNETIKRPEAAEVGGAYHPDTLEKSPGYALRFRDLPDESKPREKLIAFGPAALKNHELLAVLLTSGTTRENVIELSRRLIQEYGSRAIAQERSARRLRETLGIGTKKACQIVAAFELGRRFFEEPRSRSPVILGAEDAYEYLKDMAKFTREHFRGLYLNTRGRVIRDEIISIGSLNMSVVHPREVFLPAVEFSAAAVILAHNHPSGDPTPSEEDLVITHQMVEAGRVMGIEIFDHIIIGEEGYVSLQKEGKLK